MFDTVHLRLLADDVEGGFSEAVVERVIEGLQGGEDRRSRFNGERYIEGRIGNLFVRMDESKLFIKGSLWKYAMGNQLDQMDVDDVRRAFQQLSHVLGLPMEKARVSRLDVAQNIEVAYKPEAYNFYLGGARYFTRSQYSTTLYYTQERKQMVYYDKKKEMRRKKEVIPSAYHKLNLLRYEMRLLKQVPKLLNMASVTGQTLMEESFCKKVLKMWYDNYCSIRKEKNIGLPIERIKDVRKLKGYLQASGVQKTGGVERWMKDLKQGHMEGRLTESEFKKCKKAVRQAAYAEDIVIDSPLIEELDRKIKEKAKNKCSKTQACLPKL